MMETATVSHEWGTWISKHSIAAASCCTAIILILDSSHSACRERLFAHKLHLRCVSSRTLLRFH